MKTCLSRLVIAFVLCAVGDAGTILGTAQNYAVLAGSTITNTGPTTVSGDIGVSPGCGITGSSSITQTGSQHACDAAAAQAKIDLATAYNVLAGLPSTFNLTGVDLGGLTLTPGVYFFASSAQLTGILTLDAAGDSNAQFVFQIASTLTTASASDVNVINGSPGMSVYFQVGSSATLGTGTDFAGNILAQTSITLDTDAKILCGRALAQAGAATLDTNVISDNCAVQGGARTDFGSAGFTGAGTPASAVPEPGTFGLLGAAFAGLMATLRLRHSRE